MRILQVQFRTTKLAAWNQEVLCTRKVSSNVLLLFKAEYGEITLLSPHDVLIYSELSCQNWPQSHQVICLHWISVSLWVQFELRFDRASIIMHLLSSQLSWSKSKQSLISISKLILKTSFNEITESSSDPRDPCSHCAPPIFPTNFVQRGGLVWFPLYVTLPISQEH